MTRHILMLQFNIYVLMLLLAQGLSTLLGLGAWRRRCAPCAMTVFLMALSIFAWTGAGAVEAMVTSIQNKFVWSVVSYLGATTVAPLFLSLALEYSGRRKDGVQRWFWLVLMWLIPVLTMLFAATNPWHDWLWSSITLRESVFGIVGVYERGGWFGVFIGHAYLMVLYAVWLFLRSGHEQARTAGSLAWQPRLMAIAVLLPLAGSAAYMWNPELTGGLDFAPFFFTAGVLIIGQAVLRWHFLDLMPLPPHLLVQHLSEGICVLDQHNRLLTINSAAERILGISHTSVGKPAEQCCAMLGEILRPPLDEQERVRDLVHPGTGQVLEVMSVAVRAPRGRYLWKLVSLRDVTVRRREEQERTQLRDSLLQARKMETIGRIAGGIAHDFNNRLMGIMGYAQLSMDLALPEQKEIQRFQAEILAVSEQSAALVRQLLGYARKQPSSPQQVSVQDVLLGQQAFLEQVAGGSISLDVVAGLGNTAILIDPGQFDEILLQLVINAKEAIAKCGRITLRSQVFILHAGDVVHHPGLRPGRYVGLEVLDTGPGVDASIQDQIFEPFVSTKEPGRGLGLATVYGIVKQNNGYVYHDRTDHEHTRFVVLFPPFAGH